MEHQPSHRGGGREGAALTADTIAAVATPPGRGGIGVVRISGPGVRALGASLLGALPAPRQPALRDFCDASGQALDQGLALFFPAPHSYTGEDVLELHAHGSPVVLEALVARAVELGARRARPGEFTERAYLNGRLDLAQAEAVVDLIDAGSIAAARAATRSLQGEFSRRTEALAAAVLDLRAFVEGAIDFPEEEIDFLGDSELVVRMEAATRLFSELQAQARQGALLTEGITVVIAGAPNAGKSTLLNRLAGYEAAIVTATPGTTRDPIRERILVDGLPVRVIDTAGLRAATEPIEREGVRRAVAEMARADRVLYVVDASANPAAPAELEARAQLPVDVPVTVVINKIDLVDPDAAPVGDVNVSALSGEGMDQLREHLRSAAGLQPAEAGTMAARARHVEALQRARKHLDEAVRQLTDRRAGELVAHELQLAHRALGEITGEVGSDELLGHIFSRFCIGK